MDACSDPAIESVVFMSSAQVGKTTILKAVIGYYIDQDPSLILVIYPTLELAEAFSARIGWRRWSAIRRAFGQDRGAQGPRLGQHVTSQELPGRADHHRRREQPGRPGGAANPDRARR